MQIREVNKEGLGRGRRKYSFLFLPSAPTSYSSPPPARTRYSYCSLDPSRAIELRRRKRHLKKPKDKFGQDLFTGVTYKINCKDREKVYIGQTSRALRSRIREHKRAVFTGEENSLLARHCLQNKHEFDFDDVKIMDGYSQWSCRLFLEAWHSISEPNSINDHIHIPDMYKILVNP